MGQCFGKSHKNNNTHGSETAFPNYPPPQLHPPYPFPNSDPTPSSSSSSSPSSSSYTNQPTILGKPFIDITALYTFKKILGKGEFGVTHSCVEQRTGREYACKSIPKRKLTRKKEIEDVKREITILQHLRGQPNIVDFKDAYEDKQSVHLVMELCLGGELFDRIISSAPYSERKAVCIFRQIVNIVQACHSMGVMHRDLKPETLLFASNHLKARLKLIDFSRSVFIEEGKVYREMVGSEYYVAPEVFKRSYGKEIDVWGAGIILYILLSGEPPFWAETEKGIFETILKGKLDLESAPWPSISPAAKDLVRKMLNYDPKKRLTAAEALEHPWMKKGGEASEDLIRMKQFRAMNKMKKLALKIMAATLSEDEIHGLKQMFMNMDTDGSGTITYEELKSGLTKFGPKLNEYEMKQLMDAADIDQSGTIDYLEFITVTINRRIFAKAEHLCKALQYFDKDNSGYITIDEFRQALTEYQMGDEATIDEVINEIDNDTDTGNDCKINYKEFVAMMRKGILDHDDKDKSR